jgi:hypothetical protein|tara:strand:- start:8612 stop:9019 length:408 start_codon:yes stop_codon:yes gene_type:complete
MPDEPLRVRENSAVDLSLKNLVTVICAVAVGVWAFFGIQERLNAIETNFKLIEKDLEKNTDFRIRWPLGELGALPDDSEQFMLINHLTKQVEKMAVELETGRHNTINIDRLREDARKMEIEIDTLKEQVLRNRVE